MNIRSVWLVTGLFVAFAFFNGTASAHSNTELTAATQEVGSFKRVFGGEFNGIKVHLMKTSQAMVMRLFEGAEGAKPSGSEVRIKSVPLSADFSSPDGRAFGLTKTTYVKPPYAEPSPQSKVSSRLSDESASRGAALVGLIMFVSLIRRRLN